MHQGAGSGHSSGGKKIFRRMKFAPLALPTRLELALNLREDVAQVVCEKSGFRITDLLPAGKFFDLEGNLAAVLLPVAHADFITRKYSPHGRD